jgi:hypothetical protein
MVACFVVAFDKGIDFYSRIFHSLEVLKPNPFHLYRQKRSLDRTVLYDSVFRIHLQAVNTTVDISPLRHPSNASSQPTIDGYLLTCNVASLFRSQKGNQSS